MIDNFKKIFNHNKKSIFWIEEWDTFGDIKVNSSDNRRRNSAIVVFNSIIQITVPNDLRVIYITPEIWYSKIKEQIHNYLDDNLDSNKYTFSISNASKVSTQSLLKKDFYYMNLYISFSITDIELEKEILQNKLGRIK